MYDAAVIGGGAAGLTAAESTSTAGTYFGMELDSQKPTVQPRDSAGDENNHYPNEYCQLPHSHWLPNSSIKPV
ncbi:MAG: hypothetical protein RI575_10585, partial [Balneolaceae bacterium]|nr:hypothetical protein [Balneolaceae bacterium]